MKPVLFVLHMVCIHVGYIASPASDPMSADGRSRALHRKRSVNATSPFDALHDPFASDATSDVLLWSSASSSHGGALDEQPRDSDEADYADADTMRHRGGADDLPAALLNAQPAFDASATQNVTALVGKTASLNCRIWNLGNRTVTWIRHRDLHLLTVDKATYTPDQRFYSAHNAQTGDWSLQVRNAQRRDSGVYECQVSATPPIGHSMTLSVVEPITTIHGAPDLYIDTGSTVNLTCIVRHLPEPPASVDWTHNNQEINYDSARGGVSVITEKGEVTTSYLLIQRARPSDSGQYACLPTHANPKTVNVHVLNGEEPAAIQRGSRLAGIATSGWGVGCAASFVVGRWLLLGERWM